MRLIYFLLFWLVLALPVSAQSGEICVVNKAEHPLFFAAEAHAGRRETAMLAPGQSLCVEGGVTGMVSVYEHADAMEGCSRLVEAGREEALLRYVDFDRCFWSSNSG